MNAADTLRAAVAKKRRARQAPPPKGEDQVAVIAWQANKIVTLTIALNQTDKRFAELSAELAKRGETPPTPAGETEVTTDWAVYWTRDGETCGGGSSWSFGEEDDARECAQDFADDDDNCPVWIAQERVTRTTETLCMIPIRDKDQ